jgi:hypothetical protein
LHLLSIWSFHARGDAGLSRIDEFAQAIRRAALSRSALAPTMLTGAFIALGALCMMVV